MLKTENDIYTNKLKPEFKTLMGLTKGSMTKHAPILGEGSISRLSMLGSAPHVPTNIGVVGECPLCEFLGGGKI